jgi:hypothetical protein
MKKNIFILLLPALLILLLTACSPTSSPPITYEPARLSFSGEQAYAIEEEFVTRFTNRHSGTEQNRLATEWLQDQFESAGWTCQIDQWEVINYDVPVTLRNVVCKLSGSDPDNPREILVVAHHDQAPTTIQGADNDGSGIAILLHLAEIFKAEGAPAHTLVFVATDAEEYGMLGSLRYVETHPNVENINAGMSLDNLGRYYHDRMNMELVGQFSGYGPIWLALTARDAADAADGLWQVNLRAPLDQALDQAVPVSMMDQGPMVAAGVPALGFAAGYPPEFSDMNYNLWHDPSDTMDFQTAEALEGSGLVAEALIRQLLSMDTFPKETGPYLYFDSSKQVLRGFPLYLIFIGFLSIFFAGSYFFCGTDLKRKAGGWFAAFIHFLGFWLPLVATIFLLYLFVEVGILVEYDLYPATTKDPEMLNPDWLAVSLFFGGVAIFLFVARGLARKYLLRQDAIHYGAIKSFVLLLIGITGLYILIINPFSLLFLVPILFWFLISGRKGAGKAIDLLFFLLGGLILYALVYFFGFQILGYGIVFLWMFLNMFATGTIGFGALMAGTAVLAAGLTLVAHPS